MAGIPIPHPCFLDDCIPLHGWHGQKRWKSIDGKRLYTWDSLHGEIEVFNSRGFHLGVYDCEGNFIKDAVKGRKINV